MTALAIHALTLSHFRSHLLTQMSADGRPVAIYGENGAGKTNIIEAISMLSPGRGLRRAASSDLAARPEALGWKVKASLQSLHQHHDVETWAEPGTNRSVKVDDKQTTQVALGRIARVLWLVPTMDRLWVDAAEGRRRFLDRMALSFEPTHGDVALVYEKAMRERNRLLKDQVRDSRWYGALEHQMADSGFQMVQNRVSTLSRLSAAQSGAQTAFPAAQLDIIYPDGGSHWSDANDIARTLQDGRDRDMAAGRSLQGPHRADLSAVYVEKGVTAKNCSTGEQKALLISLVLANARALADDFGAPPVLLLDEVAAHLDSNRRAALFDEICTLGAQAWMTGTGPELFAELSARAQHFEVSEHNGKSNVTQKDPIE